MNQKPNKLRFVRNLPIIGYALSVIYNIVRLPKTVYRLEQVEKNERGALFAEDHLLDEFYARFEDKFRGDEASVYERIEKAYSDLFLPPANKEALAAYPVLDIGSGRGEFLQFATNNGLKAKGIDINHEMVKRSKAKGLDVMQGDAVKHLAESPSDGQYSAITGFHIAEHIPFQNLLRLFAACHSGLVKNGFVVFETPNPENVIVGSCNFYMDPSHLSPIPPALLQHMLETVGFTDIEIRRLHPMQVSIDISKIEPTVYDKLFGPRDYSVIAYKR